MSLAILLLTFAEGSPAQAVPYKPGKPREEPKVFGHSATPPKWTENPAGKPFQPADPVRPGNTSVEVAFPPAASRTDRTGGTGGTGGVVKAGELPTAATGLPACAWWCCRSAR
jgi:hypothetical protein